MAWSTRWGRIIGRAALGFGAINLLAIATVSVAERPMTPEEAASRDASLRHKIVLPDLQPSPLPYCEQYASAYAAALADLDAAHAAADIAYITWYECEHGTPPPVPVPVPAPDPVPDPPSHSILEN